MTNLEKEISSIKANKGHVSDVWQPIFAVFSTVSISSCQKCSPASYDVTKLLCVPNHLFNSNSIFSEIRFYFIFCLYFSVLCCAGVLIFSAKELYLVFISNIIVVNSHYVFLFLFLFIFPVHCPYVFFLKYVPIPAAFLNSLNLIHFHCLANLTNYKAP